MAFGQPGGPPASAKQVRELLELLHAAGHSDFRDARGPLGFNQRQAGGKFTRDEADALLPNSKNGPKLPKPPMPCLPLQYRPHRSNRRRRPWKNP